MQHHKIFNCKCFRFYCVLQKVSNTEGVYQIRISHIWSCSSKFIISLAIEVEDHADRVEIKDSIHHIISHFILSHKLDLTIQIERKGWSAVNNY